MWHSNPNSGNTRETKKWVLSHEKAISCRNSLTSHCGTWHVQRTKHYTFSIMFSSVQSLSCFSLYVTSYIGACQAFLPVYHQFPELTQTHVHWISDAIQPSHTLSFHYTPVFSLSWASLVAQRLKRLPPMQETQVRSLGLEDPIEKEIVTHSSILA